LRQQYASILGRSTRTKTTLKTTEVRGVQIPADIRAASDRVDAQLKAANAAIGQNDTALATQNLQQADATIAMVEKFLAGAQPLAK
jgi:hypothetical protein